MERTIDRNLLKKFFSQLEMAFSLCDKFLIETMIESIFWEGYRQGFQKAIEIQQFKAQNSTFQNSIVRKDKPNEKSEKE